MAKTIESTGFLFKMTGKQLQQSLDVLYEEDKYYQAKVQRVSRNIWLLVIWTRKDYIDHFIQLLSNI